MHYKLKFKMRLSHLELNLAGKKEEKTCLKFQQISYGANCFAKIGLKISPQNRSFLVFGVNKKLPQKNQLLMNLYQNESPA